LPERVARERITHLLCIPSLWRRVLDHVQVAGRASYAQLRQVIVAGEACPPALAAQHLRQLPAARLFNEYGPTEATVWCTVHEITASDRESVPIGRPPPGTKIHLLDATLRPVAVGEAGELFVEGSGVAAGYLNRSELTAERFLPGLRPGQGRMYRTGDLARTRQDGAIEFLGRIDEQVKIRGQRIELGEIESALVAHPAVREAAVLAATHEEGRERLVAFIAGANQESLDPVALREFLEQSLPAYMVPGRIIALPEMPHGSNGKIDRHALRQMLIESNGTSAAGPASGAIQPRTATELELCRLWAELLGHEPGIQDNFFRAGGDSLQALDLLGRVERRWNVRPPTDWLFAEPTIESLARWLESQARVRPWSPLVPIQPQGAKRPLFFIHPGGGSVLCYRHLARSLGPDQPLFGLQSPGLDGVRPPPTSVVAMAREYLAAIRQAQPHGPYSLGGWSFGGLVAYEIARLLRAAGEEVSALVIIDAGVRYAAAVVRSLFSDANVPWFELMSNPEQFLPDFLAKAVPAQILPANLPPAEARRFFDVFVANISATLDFRPLPYAGRVSLLLTSDDTIPAKCDPYREWQSWCADVRLTRLPGKHATILLPPHVDVLAAAIQSLLVEPVCP
jgi:thioesterase domain-containing protein